MPCIALVAGVREEEVLEAVMGKEGGSGERGEGRRGGGGRAWHARTHDIGEMVEPGVEGGCSA